MCGDYESTIKFLGIDGNTNDGGWQQALSTNDYMMKDPYIIDCVHRLIKQKINNAKIGKLKVEGNYQLASGDPFALMQSICGLEVTGLLKSEEIYSKYWVDKEVDELITYNVHDVRETTKFMMRCLSAIQFREELCVTHGRNFMNHNDTKIGKDYFVMELEKNGIQCSIRDETGRKLGPRQTPRDSICFADVIFPYIKFERPEFNDILNRFRSKTIYKRELDELEKAEGKKDKLVTKGVFSDLECTINGYTFVFGVGGIHGSVESQIVETTDTHQLVDIDVSSMYPSIAIANRIYPEHLGEKFCDINEYFFHELLS